MEENKIWQFSQFLDVNSEATYKQCYLGVLIKISQTYWQSLNCCTVGALVYEVLQIVQYL